MFKRVKRVYVVVLLFTSSTLFAHIPESELRSLIVIIETEKRNHCRSPNRSRTSPRHNIGNLEAI